MSRRRKLIERFLNSPETIGIAEIRQLMAELGYEEHSKAGSHCVFHKKGSYPLCVPTMEGRKVKRFYVRRLSETLNLEEEYGRTKDDE